MNQLRNDLAKLETKNRKNADDIGTLSRINPPVGSVTAFAGTWPPKKEDGTPWTEEELGWMLADGRSFSRSNFKALYEVLGKETLPSYCGIFLRGLDVRFDKSTTGRDLGGMPRTLNDEQKFATAMPTPAFSASGVGNHTHRVPSYVGGQRYGSGLNEVATGSFASYDYENSPPSEGAGAHTHTISGGDPETRPVNSAVNYIIKVKSK